MEDVPEIRNLAHDLPRVSPWLIVLCDKKEQFKVPTSEQSHRRDFIM